MPGRISRFFGFRAPDPTLEKARVDDKAKVDDAEPGTIILTYVVPGSPAARAGLEVGDRIYQVAGEDFADDAEFAQRAKAHLGPMELTVERDGQIRTAVLHFTPQPVRRAA